MVKIFEFILVHPLHLSLFFSYILSFLQVFFKFWNNIVSLFICLIISYGYQLLSYQSFDTNFSSLGLLAAEI